MKSSRPWLYPAVRALDRVGASVVRRDPRPVPSRPRRILVSNIGHLGDALLTLGVPTTLSRVFPGADIDILTSSEGATLFRGHPDVSCVHTYDSVLLSRDMAARLRVVRESGSRPGIVSRLAERAYDLGLELRSYVPNSVPILQRAGIGCIVGFGSAGFRYMLDCEVPHIDGEHELDRFHRVIRCVAAVVGHDPGRPIPWIDYLRDPGGTCPVESPYAVLHPGTRRQRKRWDPDGWRELASLLIAADTPVVVTGTAAERHWLESMFDRIPVRLVAGEVAFGGLVELLRNADAVVGVDSFPTHLAAIAGAPCVVAIWHPFADPAEWGPVGTGRIHVLAADAMARHIIAAVRS